MTNGPEMKRGCGLRSAAEFLTESERAAVVRGIAAAEERTSAEIVCAVATESGRYDRAESLAGLAAALAGLVIAHFGLAPDLANSLGIKISIVAAGYLGGSVLTSYHHPLRRVFASPREMAEEVDRAASHIFMEQRLTATRDSSGLLIYVSLFEGRVAVRADEGILTTMGQEFLDAVCQTAVEALRRGRSAEVFLSAIERAAGELEKVMPVRPDDTNEIPNALLVYHPRP